MDAPLTLDELRIAVADLTTAFLHHQALTDHQWDHAISILLVAREQHGGRIRRLIHTILNAGRPDQPADHLAHALTELHCHLAVADHPTTAIASDQRRTRRRRKPELVAHTQLRLFDSPPGDP